MPIIIYKISNSINDKVYIGQTCQNIYQRFNEHKSRNKSYKLTNAFNKYGKENFYIEIIVCCENQLTADVLETFWIKTFDSIKNGYNIREGGSHGKHSEKTKAILSELNSGKNNPWFGKIGPNKGKKLSNETRQKMSDSHKGKKRGPYQKVKT